MCEHFTYNILNNKRWQRHLLLRSPFSPREQDQQVVFPAAIRRTPGKRYHTRPLKVI
jgi:hypothetical protein